MNDVLFDKARPEDYDDLLDFIDFVFSNASVPHNFQALLPKLYKREYFMDSIHYLAREGKRIKAVIGAFPLKIEFPGGVFLPGRGIGSVSVHPRARSKGYMKALMDMAHQDMKNDGMVFSCLGGQRQRYEYFGYTPAGANYSFSVREPNIRHTLGPDWKTGLSLRPVTSEDREILDDIQAFHDNKAVKYYRSRDKLFDILSSWKSKIFAFYDNEQFEGYFVSNPGSSEIQEINLKNPLRMDEALGLVLRQNKQNGSRESAHITIGPQDIEKIRILSRFSESCNLGTAYQYNVFDFKAFVEPFLKFRGKQRTIADGSFVVKIEGGAGTTLEISVQNGIPEIRESSSSPNLILNHLEAIQFFFAPMSATAIPTIGENVFLQSLLPLPLFFESLDGV
jgi:predicted N-acetyltransferase YhbS